jgi:hypothetical protein
MATQFTTLEQELAIWRKTHDAKAFKKSQLEWAKGPAGKKSLKDWVKSARTALSTDKSALVHGNRDRIAAIAGHAAAGGAVAQQLASISTRADEAIASFDATWPAYERDVRAALGTTTGANTLRVLGQWVVGIIGFICIPSPAWWFGILLIIGVFVAGSVLKKRFTRTAWDLNGVAIRPVQITNGKLGAPARGRLDASGLYGEADHLWVSTLAPAARDAELQQRAAVKSEAASNRAGSQVTTGDYAWLNDPRITDQLNEIFINIGGFQSDKLDRTVVLNALKREITAYATVDEALPVLRDIVERQWNKFGSDGQTFDTMDASERVLYNEEQ